MRTSNKLNYLNETKELIKEALREKGVEVSDTATFRSYADKVKSISTGITPEGTMLIQQNGIYDVTTVAEVDVQVENMAEPPNTPVFGFATFNENGEYNAEDYGVDGWSFVKVEVAGSGGDKDPNETYYEMKREDYLRRQMGLISYTDIPTEEEYLEQQPIVNGLIEKIMGVAF